MDYHTIESQFDTFDNEYKVYILKIIHEYLTACGKEKIKRSELAEMIIKLQEHFPKQTDKPKMKKMVRYAA